MVGNGNFMKNYFIIKKLVNDSLIFCSKLFTSRLQAIRKFRNIVKNNVGDVYLILKLNTNDVIRITNNIVENVVIKIPHTGLPLERLGVEKLGKIQKL